MVGVSPEGVVTYSKGQPGETVPWGEIEALVRGGQLNAQTEKSYPVLRLRTKERSNFEIASSYSERVDSKAYAGMYIHLSIDAAELEELQQAIIRGAGLVQHPKDNKVWVKGKDSKPAPPAESKSYAKKVGKS